jgi:hypothetical protein
MAEGHASVASMVIVKLRGPDGPRPGALGPFKWVTVINSVAYGVRPDAKFADSLAGVNPDGTWDFGGPTAIRSLPLTAVLCDTYRSHYSFAIKTS